MAGGAGHIVREVAPSLQYLPTTSRRGIEKRTQATGLYKNILDGLQALPNSLPTRRRRLAVSVLERRSIGVFLASSFSRLMSVVSDARVSAVRERYFGRWKSPVWPQRNPLRYTAAFRMRSICEGVGAHCRLWTEEMRNYVLLKSVYYWDRTIGDRRVLRRKGRSPCFSLPTPALISSSGD